MKLILAIEKKVRTRKTEGQDELLYYQENEQVQAEKDERYRDRQKEPRNRVKETEKQRDKSTEIMKEERKKELG